MDGLQADYVRSLANHMRALDDLRAADDILREAGIPWMVIKGPVLSELYYPDPGLRSYLDVDLVVRPGDLRGAIHALEKGGCRLSERDWRCGVRAIAAEVHLVLPSGTPLDLHWHLLNVPSLRRSVRLPMAEIFDRARGVTLAGDLSVRTLDPVDSVIHLALHAVVSGGNRLVWMKDIEQVALAGPDWGLVVDRSRAARAAVAVGTMLSRARATLEAPVPVEVLRQLSGTRTWSGVVRAAELLSRFDNPSSRTPGGQVVRSTRGHLSRSFGRLACQFGGGIGRVPLRRVRAALPRWPVPAQTPSRPAEVPTPRAYCDTVERLGWDG